MRNVIIFLYGLILNTVVYAQKLQYSTSNAHSHNNYVQPNVFWEAYQLQYGSIEADIYLSADSNNLWVAHSRSEIETNKRSLDSLYLQPLVSCIKKNKGCVYADTSLRLQLMIDIKSEAVSTLQQLIKMVSKYPELVNTKSLRLVISGNRPDPAQFVNYPAFIWFDGLPGVNYTKENLERVAMISTSLRNYTRWNGQDLIPEQQETAIKKEIEQSHALNKPIRFWASPDSPDAWKFLMQWQVDFINTDHVAELAEYLGKNKTY